MIQLYCEEEDEQDLLRLTIQQAFQKDSFHNMYTTTLPAH